jgi:WD domain, G-beta repeat
MAGIFRGQGRSIARALLLALLFVVHASPVARAQLYEQPVLIVDPGMHTAPIRDIGVDAAGQIAVTGSEDKTLRVWSMADGNLLRTIRMPTGPGDIGKIYAVAVSPDGTLVAAGGWTHGLPEDAIYLFETLTGKMAARIAGLPDTTKSLAFSPDGHHLAVGLGGASGLRVYDRLRQWSEIFRDTDYGGNIYGVAFSADGQLATASLDGKVRLYDRGFRLVVPPKQVTGEPLRIAFSPDGTLLAVGDGKAPAVDLLDGHSLAQLPRPNLDGLTDGFLGAVAWSKDGRTLYAGGAYAEGSTALVLAWADAGRGARRALPAASISVSGLAALPDGRLFVATQNPFLELLEPDDRPRWAHASPNADFRGQQDRLAVSADGTIVDFDFELWGKLRFDLRARKLGIDPPADQQTIPAKQTGLAVEGWLHDDSPTLDGKPSS